MVRFYQAAPDGSSALLGDAVGENAGVANSVLTVDGDVVRKRYLRTDCAQPEREWMALTVLHEHARGLAPRPIRRESEPPTLVMSRIMGEPLSAVLTSTQTTAMVEAYRRLFSVDPDPEMPLRFRAPRGVRQ